MTVEALIWSIAKKYIKVARRSCKTIKLAPCTAVQYYDSVNMSKCNLGWSDHKVNCRTIQSWSNNSSLRTHSTWDYTVWGLQNRTAVLADVLRGPSADCSRALLWSTTLTYSCRWLTQLLYLLTSIRARQVTILHLRCTNSNMWVSSIKANQKIRL